MAIKFLNTVAVDTDVLYVDASSNKVGIGTTSPSAKLDVTSATHAAHFTSTGDQVPVRIISDYSTNVSTIGFQGANSTNSYNVRAGANSDDFVIYTANTERLRINSSGNVGIGTTSPGAKLDVNGTTNLRSVALDSVFGYSGNDIQFINTGNTTFAGNVGI